MEGVLSVCPLLCMPYCAPPVVTALREPSREIQNNRWSRYPIGKLDACWALGAEEEHARMEYTHPVSSLSTPSPSLGAAPPPSGLLTSHSHPRGHLWRGWAVPVHTVSSAPPSHPGRRKTAVPTEQTGVCGRRGRGTSLKSEGWCHS